MTLRLLAPYRKPPRDYHVCWYKLRGKEDETFFSYAMSSRDRLIKAPFHSVGGDPLKATTVSSLVDVGVVKKGIAFISHVTSQNHGNKRGPDFFVVSLCHKLTPCQDILKVEIYYFYLSCDNMWHVIEESPYLLVVAPHMASWSGMHLLSSYFGGRMSEWCGFSTSWGNWVSKLH